MCGDDICHTWPISGVLVVERCEKWCQFCLNKGISKKLQHGWAVRRHLRNVHLKEEAYKDLVVLDGWTSPKKGAMKGEQREVKRSNLKKKPRAVTSTPLVSSAQPAAQLTMTHPTHSRTSSNTSSFYSSGSEDLTLESGFNGQGDMTATFGTDPFASTTAMPLLEPSSFGSTTGADAASLSATNNLESGLNGLADNFGLAAYDSSMTSHVPAAWIEPQKVRGNDNIIEPKAPTDIQAADELMKGMNGLFSKAIGEGKLTEENVLYMLQSYEGAFYFGRPY